MSVGDCSCDDLSAMAMLILPHALLARRHCSSSQALTRFYGSFSPALVRRLAVRCSSGSGCNASKQKLVFLGTPDVSEMCVAEFVPFFLGFWVSVIFV